MIPVWQNISGPNGNCMQAAIASLLEVNLEEVPNFKESGKRALKDLIAFMKVNGYSFVRLLTPKTDLSSVKKEEGVQGYFFAVVRSKVNEGGHHAVVVDRDCNIVHPTNKKYEGTKEFEKKKDGEVNGITYIFVFNPSVEGDTEESLRKNRLTRKKNIRKNLFFLD